MTRLVRLNEVQYVNSEYDINRLIGEGFHIEEIEPIEPAAEIKPKRVVRKSNKEV